MIEFVKVKTNVLELVMNLNVFEKSILGILKRKAPQALNTF